ncbi:hypothetical protein HS1_000215 [Candidatus Desulfofervidus auxilii]|uniref:PLD phosphodiesterase domain-containing protein n=1 Tax=Desulfofervidus auxilii TaxID=1621989 RepID=A0A7U4THA2_DESA2|nr:phospholipase D-like domain-containing protein [Candidatus Desulfofervidus auxilii]AMM40021.1 hypothetical protein HS1_000215 [Candidatus Desulfofervidus auxilii]CAD7769874.1 hypothetical protein BLFGPEAP_00244 [Candidatus Methanoperedenaceae archaeon GB50]CAD7770889.1 hypothetical protein DMNBHIDG_00277 [Candidatus Methanoperedenaceae archaeon GB37]
MPLISEIVGQEGVYSLLTSLYKEKDTFTTSELNELLKETGISDNLFSELVRFGLFIETKDGFYISSLGQKITLLLKAINEDEEIFQVFQELTYFYPNLRPYEIITESITNYFIDNLYNRPDFIRVYICSPWIRLDRGHIEKIESAIYKASKQYKNIQVFVITLPIERYRSRKAIDTLRNLKQLGADIVVNDKLHAKLYISEPGPLGGEYYAIFGSENLTGRGNIELAIKIKNDNEILRKLNSYFYEIRQESYILKEV